MSAKAEMLTLTHLQCGDSHMKVLLDGPDFKAGDSIVLKEEPETLWRVVEMWPPIPRANIKRGWNNNI